MKVSTDCRRGGYFYYTRTLEGQQYQVYCRRKVSAGAGAPSGTPSSRLTPASEMDCSCTCLGQTNLHHHPAAKIKCPAIISKRAGRSILILASIFACTL